MAYHPQEKGGRQSVAGGNQCLEYLSPSYHSLHNTSRHVMSTVYLTHEMAKIKEHFAWSTDIRADAQQ
jgi:hypothetical protein